VGDPEPVSLLVTTFTHIPLAGSSYTGIWNTAETETQAVMADDFVLDHLIAALTRFAFFNFDKSGGFDINLASATKGASSSSGSMKQRQVATAYIIISIIMWT